MFRNCLSNSTLYLCFSNNLSAWGKLSETEHDTNFEISKLTTSRINPSFNRLVESLYSNVCPTMGQITGKCFSETPHLLAWSDHWFHYAEETSHKFAQKCLCPYMLRKYFSRKRSPSVWALCPMLYWKVLWGYVLPQYYFF